MFLESTKHGVGLPSFLGDMPSNKIQLVGSELPEQKFIAWELFLFVHCYLYFLEAGLYARHCPLESAQQQNLSIFTF